MYCIVLIPLTEHVMPTEAVTNTKMTADDITGYWYDHRGQRTKLKKIETDNTCPCTLHDPNPSIHINDVNV